MIFSWKKMARGLLAHDAQAIGDQILELYEEHGDAGADVLVTAARRAKRSPLGQAIFDRTVEEAAEAHWRSQAGYVLRSILYLPETDDEEQHPIRAFLTLDVEFEEADPSEPDTMDVTIERVTAPTKVVMSNAEMRDAALRTAKRELKAFREKYRDLKQLAGVFAEIDAL